MSEDREFGEITCDVKAVADQDRVLSFVGTSAIRDRTGDELTVGGWNFKHYKRNPVVMFGHNYGSLPIGKTVKIHKDDNKWVFDVEFASEEDNPLAQQVFNLCKKGFLRGVSVGFRSLKSEWIDPDGDDELEQKRAKEEPDAKPGKRFSKKELLELSVVPIPANPEALMLAHKRGLELPDQVKRELGNIALERSIEALRQTREIKDRIDKLAPETQEDIDSEEKPGWEDLPSEFAYRVRDPKQFQRKSFRRVPLQKDKPVVLGIMGKLEGQTSMTLQSLRFPKKEDWTMSEARKWLEAHKELTKKDFSEVVLHLIEEELIDQSKLCDWLAWTEEELHDNPEEDVSAQPEAEIAEKGVDDDMHEGVVDDPAQPEPEIVEKEQPQKEVSKVFRFIPTPKRVYRLVK